MSDPSLTDSTDPLAPVHIDERRSTSEGRAGRLVLFLRAVAALSLAKGLYHWAMICGFGAGAGGGFKAQSSPWQIALIVGYVFIAFEATREQPE